MLMPEKLVKATLSANQEPSKMIFFRTTAFIALLSAGVLAGCSQSVSPKEQTPARPLTLEQYNSSLPKDVFPDSRSRIPLARREYLDDVGKKAYDERVSPDSTSLAGMKGPGGIRLHASSNLSETQVDRRTQELARLVVAREMDQVFEWGMHEPVALKEGLDPAIIDVIRHDRPLSSNIPPKDASVIQLGREFFQNHRVSSKTFAEALKHMGRRNLIDLCDLMGGYATTAILLNMVDVHLPYNRPPLLPMPGKPTGPEVPAKQLTLAQYDKTLPPDVFPDSRSRIPLIRRDDLDEEGKRDYDERVSPKTTSLAGLQCPGGLGLHGSRDLAKTEVDRRLQELARLVVAREFDQVFEWGMHEPVALQEGLEPAIIDVIRNRKPLGGVFAKEAAIIRLGREVLQTNRISSETFAAALQHLGRKNLIDLARLMGNYIRSAILLHTMDVHLPYNLEPRLPVS